MKSIKIVKAAKELRKELESRYNRDFKNIGFVPTMGSLHKGHLSLIEHARKNYETVVVSIFVNPTQFGPSEDFESYPRELEKDLSKIGDLADFIFSPDIDELYPNGKENSILFNDPPLKALCANDRSGHFSGVFSVVLKLIQIVRPENMIMGLKDFQQFQLLSQMVKEYFIPMKMTGLPTVRESDGLAMSSRNAYLNDESREIATKIFRAMIEIRENARPGLNASEILKKAHFELSQFFAVDYLEIRNQMDLSKQENLTKDSRIFFAGKIGNTRLIDNMAVFGDEIPLTF